MNCSVVIDWKFVAALGLLVLAIKVKPEDAKEALVSGAKISAESIVAYNR